MINLEDINTKENLIQDFYRWLFDNNNVVDKSVILEKEVDFSLAPYYTDPYIYYPKQIANFFNTKAMQRLGRVSQLALANDIYPNIYHSRLEHSKGVYNRKLEEFLYHFQDSNWRKYIDENHLKLYLLADLIKMAGHDIGHLPLSHLMETEILSYRGAHEDLGKRIMLEDSEIQNVLLKISPKLPDTLNDLYNKHIMNFKEHDESSFDVDRCDYVSRDYLYFGLPIHLPYSHYESISVELDSNGKPLENNDGSVKTSGYSKHKIDVYDEKQLFVIEKLLEKRLEGYRLIYSDPLVFAHEKTINAFFNAFKSKSKYFDSDLKTLISDFKDKGIDKIRNHAYDFVTKRLADTSNVTDGKQTPMKGHPVFIAQHATGTCCRRCLEKWHHISKNKNMTNDDIKYVVDIIMSWIEKEYNNYKKTT